MQNESPDAKHSRGPDAAPSAVENVETAAAAVARRALVVFASVGRVFERRVRVRVAQTHTHTLAITGDC